MITLRDLELRRGKRTLFSGANLVINAGFRVGVVGRNGAGKSSFLSLLLGEHQPDQGSFELARNIRVASVAQELPGGQRSVSDTVIDGDIALRAVEQQIETLTATKSDGIQLAHLHDSYAHLGGYTAKARAAALASGLGFKTADLGRPVAEFSGGWRMRVNLARALMCPSDLLLLDEPTNHLDLDAVIWLEQWLKSYAGTLIFVSHDRAFLEQIATHILHFDGRTLTLNTGNLSTFERQQAERLASEQALRTKQQRAAARIQRFVERFGAKATKARQAQSRLKILAKMEVVAAAHVDAPIDIEFATPDRLPEPLLTLREVSGGYADQIVLMRVELSLQPGDRVGLIGPNGAGKSTLMKLLAGEQMPSTGERLPSEHLRTAYFAQHQLELMDADVTALELLRQVTPQRREQDLLDHLGAYGFSGDRAQQRIGGLSGGEKARLFLSSLLLLKPNLLLLDEPTNHLDLDMRDALALALLDFAGAVVLVSHDRNLLDAVSQQLLLVYEGRVQEYPDDLDAYSTWITQRYAAENKSLADSNNPERSAVQRRQQRQDAALARQRRQPLVQECTRCEQRVEKLNIEQQALNALLGDPTLYADGKKDQLQRLLQQQGRLQAELQIAEADWLAALTELETFSDN